jgi:hypothetical protein
VDKHLSAIDIEERKRCKNSLFTTRADIDNFFQRNFLDSPKVLTVAPVGLHGAGLDTTV